MRIRAVVLLLATVAGIGAFAADGVDGARAVASAYLDAVESSDLDAAGSLFAETSSVYESGGVEGSWAHYREHHLGAEIEAIASFEIDRGEPEIFAGRDGTLAVVAWPIEYAISLKDGRNINSKGTVTFAMIRGDGPYEIRHLHWSSRRR
jgi:hypothetical protein